MYLHDFFFPVMSINLSFLMNTLEKKFLEHVPIHYEDSMVWLVFLLFMWNKPKSAKVEWVHWIWHKLVILKHSFILFASY
jgi:hypothetical protein